MCGHFSKSKMRGGSLLSGCVRETFKNKTVAKKARCGFKAKCLTCGLVLQEKKVAGKGKEAKK